MATEILELQLRVTGGGVATSQFGNLEKSAAGATNALKLMRNALVLASSVRLAEGLFTIIDSFQRMQQQLQLVTGNLGFAQTAFRQVYQIAQDSRAPLEAVNTLYQRLVRVGGTMSLTYEDVAKVTKGVAQSFAIAGASATETHNAIVQLTQGLNLGILRGQDLRSVVEFNPVLAQAFADKLYSLGLTVDKYGNKIQLAGGQLYSFVTAHKNILTAKIAIDAIKEAADGYQARIDATIPTIGQLATQIRNTFSLVVGTLFEASGAMSMLTKGMVFLKENLGPIVAGVGLVGAALASWLVLDIITAQFAKLFALRGIFGFLLSPITNVALGLKNLVIVAGDVVLGLYNLGAGLVNFASNVVNGVEYIARGIGAAFSAAVSVVSSVFAAIASSVGPLLSSAFSAISATIFAFSGGIQTAFAGLGVGVNIALAASVAMRTLAEAFQFSALTATATALAVQFLEYTLVSTTVLGAEAIGTITTITTGFRQLVLVTGSVTNALVSLGAAAVSALGSALLGVFASILVLLPTLLLAVQGITVAFGGLLALGGGLLGLGGAFDGLANSVLSWHDIFNSFFRVVLTGFDVLSEHLPLVFNVIKEKWHNFIYDMISTLPVIFQALRTYLVDPILTFIDVMAKLAPIVGALAGAAAGGPVGAVIGALAGGAAGIAAQHFKSGIQAQFDSLGASANDLVAKAAKETGTAYSDELFNHVIPDAFAGHAGDFYKAFKLLGKGLPLDEIAKETGVTLGDLTVAKKLQGLIPQTGQQADLGKTGGKRNLDNLLDQNRQQLDSLVSGADPFAKYISEQDRIDKVMDKIINDNKRLAAAGKETLDVEGQLAVLGITREDIINRQARAVIGAGNAQVELDGIVRVADELLAKHVITIDEHTNAILRATRAMEDATTGNDAESRFAGIQSAIDTNKLARDNTEEVSKQIVLTATAGEQALFRYRVEYESLSDALVQGNIHQKQFDETLRDSAITALDTQTDAVSGYERGLLKLSKAFHNTAADVDNVFTGLFSDLDDQFTNFLSGDKFDFGAIGKNLEKAGARATSHQILAPVVDSLINQGGFLGTIGAGLSDSLGKPDGTHSAPLWVRLIDSGFNPAGLNSGLFQNGASSGSGGGLLDLLFKGSSNTGGKSSDPFGNILGSVGGGGDIFSNLFGGSGEAFGGGDFIGSASDAGPGIFSSLASLFGFASGGSFDVGGNGGTDSQFVQFKATPGEHVSVGQEGGGDVKVIVNDYRTGKDAQAVETKSSTSPDGQRQLEIFIRDTTNKNLANGAHDSVLNRTYGISRAGTQR